MMLTSMLLLYRHLVQSQTSWLCINERWLVDLYCGSINEDLLGWNWWNYHRHNDTPRAGRRMAEPGEGMARGSMRRHEPMSSIADICHNHQSNPKRAGFGFHGSQALAMTSSLPPCLLLIYKSTQKDPVLKWRAIFLEPNRQKSQRVNGDKWWFIYLRAKLRKSLVNTK